MKLSKGTRIYYGGDMANAEGTGTIHRETVGNWGTHYHITLDDGREQHGIAPCMFSEKYLGHGGTRFVTLEAYNEYRRNKLIAMKYPPDRIKDTISINN